jgi:coenzyme PQQ precursor peptide PqqA
MNQQRMPRLLRLRDGTGSAKMQHGVYAAPSLHFSYKEILMQKKTWSRPNFTETSLGCEINCYSPAQM